MDFKIEKGYPLPDAWPGFVRALRKLKVGDSFLIPDPGLATQNTIWALARRESLRVSVRQMQGGLRIWRVEDRQHMNTADVNVKRTRKDLNRHMKHDPLVMRATRSYRTAAATTLANIVGAESLVAPE